MCQIISCINQKHCIITIKKSSEVVFTTKANQNELWEQPFIRHPVWMIGLCQNFK